MPNVLAIGRQLCDLKKTVPLCCFLSIRQVSDFEVFHQQTCLRKVRHQMSNNLTLKALLYITLWNIYVNKN